MVAFQFETLIGNYERTTTQMLEMEVPKNKFDSESFNWNLNNILYYPIGLVNCRGGNHSQYVAKLKSDIQTRIRTVLNIEQFYDFVHFDGSQFEYNYPNDPISLFEKVYPIKNEDEFYYGVLFEIGRLILKWTLYRKILKMLLSNHIKFKKSYNIAFLFLNDKTRKNTYKNFKQSIHLKYTFQ